MTSARTVTLTGVTGFIAKRIACDLLAAGHSVTGTLRSPARADEVRAALAPHLPHSAMMRLRFATADLTADSGWAEAMAGADALIHTASPFPIVQPRNPEELIRPAVDGTLRALRAAEAAGVRQVVLTSSMVAILNSPRTDPRRDETDWTDPEAAISTPYDQSKTLAERAAWQYVAEHPEMSLATVNPGLVLGRPLDRNYGSSLQLIERILSGRDPMQPNFGLPVTDIADVSALHLAALTRPETAGERLIACDRFMMIPEIARILADAYPDRRIATRIAPKPLLRMLSFFDPSVRTILPTIGRQLEIDTSRTRARTGIAFRPARESLLETAAFIVEAEAERAAA